MNNDQTRPDHRPPTSPSGGRPWNKPDVLALRFCGSQSDHGGHAWSGCRCPGTGTAR